MKVQSFIKQHIAGFLIITFFVLAAVSALTLWVIQQRMLPTQLGPQLEYIGKHDSGCQIPRTSYFCDGKPQSEYFFATDLDENGLKNYFSKVSATDEPEGAGSVSANYSSRGIQFTTKTSETFLIRSYDNTAAVLKAFHLKQTGKSHVISIDDKGYVIAQKAL